MPQAQGRSVLLQKFAQGNILHQINVRKTTYGLKEFSLDKDSLIPRSNASDSGTPVHQPFDDTKKRMLTRKSLKRIFQLLVYSLKIIVLIGHFLKDSHQGKVTIKDHPVFAIP